MAVIINTVVFCVVTHLVLWGVAAILKKHSAPPALKTETVCCSKMLASTHKTA
jgi:hypothetical protein